MGVLLHLDKRPDPRVVADRAAIEVDEGMDLHVAPEANVGSDPLTRLAG
jgi:hypothetical protein